MNIKTEYEPLANAWCALDEDTYDGDTASSNSIIGWGSTKEEAIESLQEQFYAAHNQGVGHE